MAGFKVQFDKIFQNFVIVGLFIIAIHMLLSNKIVNENEGFAQGELIPSGHSQYIQQANEQELKNYIFNEASENDILDKSYDFTNNVIQLEDPNLQRYDTTFRPQPVSNNQDLQTRIAMRKAGDEVQTYQSYGDNMKVYEYSENEQTDLTGGKFAGVLSPYNEDEQNEYSML